VDSNPGQSARLCALLPAQGMSTRPSRILRVDFGGTAKPLVAKPGVASYGFAAQTASREQHLQGGEWGGESLSLRTRGPHSRVGRRFWAKEQLTM
jgi:hypothetical protein